MSLALLITSDLMLSSQATGAASRAGCELRVLPNVDAALKVMAEQSVGLAVLDLGTPGNDPEQVLPQLREASTEKLAVVAFGPHVHKQRLAAARDASCEMVISRGQFHAQAEEIIRQYCAASED